MFETEPRDLDSQVEVVDTERGVVRMAFRVVVSARVVDVAHDVPSGVPQVGEKRREKMGVALKTDTDAARRRGLETV